MNTFKCKACSEIKSISEFYKSTTTLKGHDSTCKVCREDNKRARVAKRKKWQHKEVYGDNVNAARNASTYDLSIPQLVKIGDERRFRAGVERIKKKGYVSEARAEYKTILTKGKDIYLTMKIRADGVLFTYTSERLKSKSEAQKKADYVYKNALKIISNKLGLKEVA